eukprot:TRINITY_DN2441_c0_g1_i1.p1 TRINITY_DN2441_c0_g1~~TRINITY_DN2441_c0_g1_i1.p1  ORF type:complete len:728 (+),score=108.61 TRINITY_DN2441_c0_g1_i1:255-2438(+)
MTAFEEFGVMPELVKAVEELGWFLPTAIQAEAIPLILGGGDVLAAAETGSGKTGAFSLPILQITHETLRGEAQQKVQVGAAADVRPVRLNVSDRDAALAVQLPECTSCQSRIEHGWAGARATLGVTKGAYYFEAQVADEGLCRVGWSTRAARYDLGTDALGFGFGGTGMKSHARKFEKYGEPFAKGDVIGCGVDLRGNGGTITFWKNGRDLGKAFDLPRSLNGQNLFPAVVLKNAQITFNFGTSPSLPLRHLPKSYLPLGVAEDAHVSVVCPTTDKGKTSKRLPIVLVLEPSRELAQQTHEAIGSFVKYLPSPHVESVCVTGGMPASQQIKEISRGVDVVTGTPGRLADLILKGHLDLSNIRYFVLDEADRLLDGGGKKMIMDLYRLLPKPTLQVLMFSATLHSQDVRQLAESITQFPIWVDLKGKDSVPDSVHHACVVADPFDPKLIALCTGSASFRLDGVHSHSGVLNENNNSPDAISQAVKRLKPILLKRVIDAYDMDQAIIFVRTKVQADNIEEYLRRCGGGGSALASEYSCKCLHADKAAAERRDNLQAFKNGDIRFLICSDVAARGIDVMGLPYVINYTLPDNAEDYIHRVGRVGRADKMGLAVSIVAAKKEKVWYHQCKSRGKNCNNRELTSKGGCTIWYDELSLLDDVEERLDENIPRIGDDFKLASEGGAEYGAQNRGKKRRNTPTVIAHTQFVRPAAKELARLELDAQDIIWNHKKR